MRNYQNMDIWKQAHLMVLDIYKHILPKLPMEERYAIKEQIRRAAYSIPLNIAEGCGRGSEKDFTRFLDYALGSAHELEYLLLLAKDLDYILADSFEKINRQIGRVKAMLIGFIKYLRKKAAT